MHFGLLGIVKLEAWILPVYFRFCYKILKIIKNKQRNFHRLHQYSILSFLFLRSLANFRALQIFEWPYLWRFLPWEGSEKLSRRDVQPPPAPEKILGHIEGSLKCKRGELKFENTTHFTLLIWENASNSFSTMTGLRFGKRCTASRTKTSTSKAACSFESPKNSINYTTKNQIMQHFASAWPKLDKTS